MIDITNCRLIIDKGISKKNDKEYYALYLVTESNDRIFLTFVRKYVFDNLVK